jgi:hypothetical protein
MKKKGLRMRRASSMLGACVLAVLAACASTPGERHALVSVSLPSAQVDEATRLRRRRSTPWPSRARRSTSS